MNADLELRLRPFRPYLETCPQASKFWYYLCENLGEYALSNNPDGTINYYFTPIENGEDDSAYVMGDGEEFDIYIDTRMPLGMMIDALIHELSHVQSWHYDEENDHGPMFGVAYADIYSKYLELYEVFWT